MIESRKEKCLSEYSSTRIHSTFVPNILPEGWLPSSAPALVSASRSLFLDVLSLSESPSELEGTWTTNILRWRERGRERKKERGREGKKERERKRKSEWERVSDRRGKRKRLGLDEFISRLNNCSKRIKRKNTSILIVVIVIFWNRPVVFQKNPK